MIRIGITKPRVVKAKLTDKDSDEYDLIVFGVIMPDSKSLHYRYQEDGSLVKKYWTWASTDLFKELK